MRRRPPDVAPPSRSSEPSHFELSANAIDLDSLLGEIDGACGRARRRSRRPTRRRRAWKSI